MRTVSLLVVLLAATAACSALERAPGRTPESVLEGDQSRMTQRPSGGVTTDPVTISAALQFGGIVLPPSALVLGVQHDSGIDERYRMAVRLAGDEVPELLAGSGFAAPLAADAGPFPASVAGFDLSTAQNTQAASDSLAPGAGRLSTVFREIVVDHSSPAAPVVHLWLFTT